jgi:hypothetical protein
MTLIDENPELQQAAENDSKSVGRNKVQTSSYNRTILKTPNFQLK